MLASGLITVAGSERRSHNSIRRASSTVSSLQANLPTLPTTLLIGGEVAMRFQHELEGAGITTGIVESGGEAVLAVREGGYQAVIVPAVLPDMSSYDFCMSLLRHMDGIFVVLYGKMDAMYADPLQQTGRVAHVSGLGHESMPHVLAGRFGVQLPPPPAPATPSSGSHAPPGGRGAPAVDAAQRERLERLQEDLGVAESELEDARARLTQAEAAAKKRASEVKSVERRLGEAVEELATLRVELDAARKTADRAQKERDGLKALIASLEEDRSDMERKLATLDELEKDKRALEQMVSELTRKLAAKRAEPQNLQREREEGLTDALANLTPLTWDVVQAADWLQENDAPSDHVRALRIAVRSVETLLEEARSRGLIKS